MKRIWICLLLITLVLGCAGPTKLTYQDLPKDRPLAMQLDNVTFRVVSFGYAADWSELEIAVANETDSPINFDPTKVYLTNEKGYDLIPLGAHEINDRIHRKTGQWINPLTIGAIASGLAYLIAPSAHDRAAFGKAAVALAGGAAVYEGSERQSAEGDVRRKEDLLLKNYTIPPKLQLGGTLYYRSTQAMKGTKAFIKIKGTEEFFQIQF